MGEGVDLCEKLGGCVSWTTGGREKSWYISSASSPSMTVNMGVDLGGWEGVMVCDPLTGGRSENLGATKSRRDIRSHSPLISYLHTRPNIKTKKQTNKILTEHPGPQLNLFNNAAPYIMYIYVIHIFLHNTCYKYTVSLLQKN